MDVVDFCTKLIKCQSVTPYDDGAIDCIDVFLSGIGFETKILQFKSEDGSNVVKNLFAKIGNPEKKTLGFLGHSDVVVPGDGWECNPFEGVQVAGHLVGRGVADMKGGIAAFCCAVAKFIDKNQDTFEGAIEFLITGDEEIGSYEGARSLIKWCDENGNIPDDCLVGEPSSFNNVGDHIYIGHRGSLNVSVKAFGQQGHVAYPEYYQNSLANICGYISQIKNYEWKHEDKRYPRTNLEPTMLFTNNYAENVVPDMSSARLNIRYGADYTAGDLKKICEKESKQYDVVLDFTHSADPYISDDPALKNILSAAIADITGISPIYSCGGGTSDGRYIFPYCNVIEFGLPGSSIHQKNEKAKVDDLLILEKIYLSFIEKYFAH